MRIRELISEVSMKPGHLAKKASGIKAHAGMEFEMYVRDIGSFSRHDESLTALKSIEQICDVFSDNRNNDIYALRDALTSDYKAWASKNAKEEWSVDNEGIEDFYAYEKMYMGENFNKSWHIKGWFRSAGLHDMSDIEHEYDVSFGDDEPPELADTARSFSRLLGRPVKTSAKYHGVTRDNVHYIIEPDGSLHADPESDDVGLEFISPPLPLPEMLDDLSKVLSWARINRCYTDNLCGLHMNVSLDNVDINQLDYVKLALFVGDEYILNQFGRLGNTYAQKSIDSIIKNIDRLKRTGDSIQLLQQAQKHLAGIAHKSIHDGITKHHMSMDVHRGDSGGYVEFRHAGGDWMRIKVSQLQSTLNRFVVALEIACNPNMYKEEYAKKLYKLFNPGMQSNPKSQLFSDYFAGKIDKQTLINKLAQNKKPVQFTREWKVELKDNSPYMARFMFDGNTPSYVEVYASDAKAAIEAARPLWRNQELERVASMHFAATEI